MSKEPEPKDVVAVGRSLASVLAPDFRWYITDWRQCFEDRAFNGLLAVLRGALEKAWGEIPESFDESVQSMARTWDSAIREHGNTIPLLLLSLRFALWADAADEDERGGNRPVRLARFLACLAWAMVSARRGIMQADFRGYLDAGWNAARRLEEMDERALGALIAKRVRRVLGKESKDKQASLAEEAAEALRLLDLSSVIRGEHYTELERLDPLQSPLEDLGKCLWAWCWERLDPRGRSILGVSTHLEFLQSLPCFTPDYPAPLFSVEDEVRRRFPGEFTRYVHCFRRARYYWKSANAAGLLPAFTGPDDTRWEASPNVHDCRAIAADVGTWARQEEARLVDHLVLPHLPAGGHVDAEKVQRRADQTEGPSPSSGPPRVWSEKRCPICGRQDVEFLSYSEFSRRSKGPGMKSINRTTVSRRVRAGKYCANAVSQVPWCPRCKEATPGGAGTPGAGAPQVPDAYELTEANQKDILTWAGAVMLRKFPEFDPEFVSNAPGSDDTEDACYWPVLEALQTAFVQSRGDLRRDQAEQIGGEALEKAINAAQTRRRLERPSFAESWGLENGRP